MGLPVPVRPVRISIICPCCEFFRSRLTHLRSTKSYIVPGGQTFFFFLAFDDPLNAAPLGPLDPLDEDPPLDPLDEDPLDEVPLDALDALDEDALDPLDEDAGTKSPSSKGSPQSPN